MGLRIADIASHLRSARIAFAHAAVKARVAGRSSSRCSRRAISCFVTWLGKEQGVFRERFPLEGYRQLAFIHDARPGILAASPSSMYRSCSRCGHERWQIDIAYLNLEGTYYLCSSVNDQFPVEISCPREPGGQPHLDHRASAAHSVRFCINYDFLYYG